MASLRALLSAVAALLPVVSAGVVVTKTDQGPTGYEVTITYTNTSAKTVTIGGTLPPLTNQWRTSPNYGAQIDPHDYKPGDYPSYQAMDFPGFPMTAKGNGTFVFKAPYPSGTYQYAFLPDCAYAPNCTDAELPDPDNVPFQTIPGTATRSVFQVPYDDRFQHYDDMNLNWDYALPLEDEAARGTLKAETYRSPGSVSPAPDVHDYAIYLPPGYCGDCNTTYPVLYISHGGGGDAGDWPAKGKMANIMDRLIAAGHVEPTVVVSPTFNGLTGSGDGDADSARVRALYTAYLFPAVEAAYAVAGATDPDRRAFAGLSLGGALTYEFYRNATADFGYFGIWSGARFSGTVDDYLSPAAVRAQPALANRGLMVAYGQFDIAADDVQTFRQALDNCGVRYAARVTPWGYHAWSTWQDNLWNFGRVALWKPRPFTDEVGHGL
ncbi:carbohydrate esterase family 1 protein [Xylariomycetidae sp. FL0641]|nr:carbohydrate esterase family 1 protein [Xylariomycetidae sp. FL0641]